MTDWRWDKFDDTIDSVLQEKKPQLPRSRSASRTISVKPPISWCCSPPILFSIAEVSDTGPASTQRSDLEPSPRKVIYVAPLFARPRCPARPTANRVRSPAGQCCLTATPISAGVEARCPGLRATCARLWVALGQSMIFGRRIGSRSDEGGARKEDSNGDFDCGEAKHCGGWGRVC